jgi:membrane protein YdbS with pleckstrin-like domain
MTDAEKKRLQNNISHLVNLLILSNFLMFRFASDPNIWTLNLTIISFVIFIAALALANVWLYYTYYRKTRIA